MPVWFTELRPGAQRPPGGLRKQVSGVLVIARSVGMQRWSWGGRNVCFQRKGLQQDQGGFLEEVIPGVGACFWLSLFKAGLLCSAASYHRFFSGCPLFLSLVPKLLCSWFSLLLIQPFYPLCLLWRWPRIFQLHASSTLVTTLPQPAGLCSCAILCQKSEARECMTLRAVGTSLATRCPFSLSSRARTAFCQDC